MGHLLQALNGLFQAFQVVGNIMSRCCQKSASSEGTQYLNKAAFTLGSSQQEGVTLSLDDTSLTQEKNMEKASMRFYLMLFN